MATNLQENFELLQRLFGGSLDELPEAAKSERSGFMNLNFDRIGWHRAGVLDVALSHYYQVNGDSVADPDMVVRIDFAMRTVEAMSYQDALRYHEVYRDGARDERQFRSQNAFLTIWLRNCISQGHVLRAPVPAVP